MKKEKFWCCFEKKIKHETFEKAEAVEIFKTFSVLLDDKVFFLSENCVVFERNKYAKPWSHF